MGIFETLSYVVPELMLAVGAMVLLIVGVFNGGQIFPLYFNRFNRSVDRCAFGDDNFN